MTVMVPDESHEGYAPVGRTALPLIGGTPKPTDDPRPSVAGVRQPAAETQAGTGEPHAPGQPTASPQRDSSTAVASAPATPSAASFTFPPKGDAAEGSQDWADTGSPAPAGSTVLSSGGAPAGCVPPEGRLGRSTWAAEPHRAELVHQGNSLVCDVCGQVVIRAIRP